MGYADLKILSNDSIGVYCRVSTSGQNIRQQESLAEVYLAQNKINTDNVYYFLDDNISANKMASEKRPELNKLISEIQKGKIKTVLVQNRDRLARNFYEYIDLVKVFYKYNVNVIFTDSSQPPFSKTLSVESLYGIFAQSEGRNIADRTSLAALQFPNSVLGFNVIGKRNTKKYTPKPEMERDIKSLFYSVENINSAEELIEQLMRYKKVSTNNLKLLACLKNPFYAGYIKVQDKYVRLPHVEPIILLDDYLKVQECLLKFEQEIQVSITKSNEKGLLQPICSSCKTVMTFRSNNVGGHGYYVCVKNHSRLFIEAPRYNQLILEHFTYVLNKVNVKEIKKDVFICLLAQEKQYNKQLSFKENQLKSIHKEITDLLATNKKRKINLLIEQSKTIVEKIKELNTALKHIDEARKGINFFVKTVNEQFISELHKYQQKYLIQLLFSKVEVSSDSIFYHTNFGNYIKGDEM